MVTAVMITAYSSDCYCGTYHQLQLINASDRIYKLYTIIAMTYNSTHTPTDAPHNFSNICVFAGLQPDVQM